MIIQQGWAIVYLDHIVEFDHRLISTMILLLVLIRQLYIELGPKNHLSSQFIYDRLTIAVW